MKFETYKNKIRHLAVDIETLASIRHRHKDDNLKSVDLLNGMSYRSILDEMSELARELEHLNKYPFAVGFVEYDSNTGKYTLDGRTIEEFDRLDIIYNCVDADNAEWEIFNKDSEIEDDMNSWLIRHEDENAAAYFLKVANYLNGDVRNKKVYPITVVNDDGTEDRKLYIDCNIEDEITGIFAMMRV